MPWTTPSMNDLARVAQSATQSLHICSPFITRPGITTLEKSLPKSNSKVEIWTKFDFRDWITGASELDSLLEFIEGLPASSSIEMRISERLHAKFILANEQIGIAGSANLTQGGYAGNIEIVRLIGAAEATELKEYIDTVKPALAVANLTDLQEFVSTCQDKAREKEALLDLIRESVPEPVFKEKSIIPISEFMAFVNQLNGFVPDEVSKIYLNSDRNNRTGHLKQAYYGVQVFLREHPDHLSTVSRASLDDAYDVRSHTQLIESWLNFFRDAQEADEFFAYDLNTLRGYLTPNFGGVRTGGGGGDYPFRLVWVPVARMLSQENS